MLYDTSITVAGDKPVGICPAACRSGHVQAPAQRRMSRSFPAVY